MIRRSGSVLVLAMLVACGRNQPGEGRPTAAGFSSDTVRATIGDIRASKTPVGQVVRVTGRCLDVQSSLPIGPPPRSRHDWQMAEDTAAVYVSGRFPEACSATGAPVTIVARVVEDTLPGLGGRPAVARRYLVRLPDK
jgi:hypothetical protein